MEANELRVGNLLSYGAHGISTVVDIRASGKIKIHIHSEDSHAKGYIKPVVHCLYLDPIPLTPEWLERCGFRQQGDWYLLDEGRGLMYSYNDDGSVYGFYIVTEYANLTEWNPRPVYLHQLQNLYFCLTGEELQIKIP